MPDGKARVETTANFYRPPGNKPQVETNFQRAVANAVYDATGVRIRDSPVTLDRVRAGLDARRVT